MKRNNLQVDSSLSDQLRDKKLLDEAQAIGKLGGWELDLETGELYWTAETYRLHDTSPEEFNPTVDAGVGYYLPESRIRLEKALDLAINQGIGYDLFLETHTTKGRLIYVRTTCKVTLDAQGKAEKLTGIFQDISSIKRLESIFHSYKYSVDQHSLVSVTNIAGKIIYVNDLFCQVSGYKEEELLGSDHKILNSGHHPRGYFKEMYQLLMTGEVWKGEIKNKTKSGSYYWVDTTIIPLRDEQNKIYQYMSIRSDVTAKKAAESALLESQRLNAIGEMASSVAHDFNNSLQAIIGNLEVAKLVSNDQRSVLKYLSLIEEVAFNVKDRVKSLQGFGKPEARRNHSDPIVADDQLKAAVKELEPVWKGQAQKEGISVEVELKMYSDSSRIHMSKGDFKNIIYNLMKNSVEAIESSGKITLTTSIIGDNYVLRFKDDGCGMPADVVEKAFIPFYSTKTFEVGRGLGLSGVYTLVNQSQGSIRIVETAVGKGTEFEILLPLLQDQSEGLYNSAVIESSRSLSILWVEDDPNIGENAQLLVESLGHTCTWLDSAKKALDVLSHQSFDLILSDVGMVEMNGLEFRTELLKRQINAPFAVISGWDISAEDQAYYKMDFTLSKPFSLKELKSAIDRVVSKSN